MFQNLFKKKEWPCPFDNPVEASLFSSLLTEEDIPHTVVSHGDALWGYSEQVTGGWGHVETTAENQQGMETLYQEFLSSDSPEGEEVPEAEEIE